MLIEGVRVLDLRRLRLLRELARRGTIASVAEAVAYSPSAVSQQLSTLEREAGVVLLEPVGRRLRLTPQGELLVARTELILELLEQTEAALAAMTGVVAGTLRIAAFQTAVTALVVPALTELNAQHPELRVEVTVLEPEIAIPALIARDYDVVLGEEYPGSPLPLRPEVERAHLLTDQLRLAVPDSWDARTVRAAAERPWVMEPEGTAARAWSNAVCRAAGFEPDVRFTTTDIAMHRHLVQSGHAAALLPDLAGPPAASARTHRLPGGPHRNVFLAVRTGGGEHPAVAPLIRALTKNSTASS